MPRRIDVELTSVRDDGTWTWRAAGAREPRGVVDGGLLPGGASVGNVVRAEADFDIEGITILSILPPKEGRQEPERIEILGSPNRDEPGVTTSLVGRRERGPGRDRDRDREPRGPRDGQRERRDRDRPRGRERARTGEPAGPTEGDRAARARPERRDGRRDEPGAERRAPRTRTPGASRPPQPKRDEPARPKAKRLRAGRVHRKAVLESIPPEQRPIAEHVLAGGIPAVRQAVERQNEEMKAQGKPEVKAEPLVALAEQLLPRLRTAEWRDRAEAALADIDELDLRDLRSVVVAADNAARDEETRTLAAQLREALGRRVDSEHAQWLDELSGALGDGRVVRALRLSSRPPKAGALLPPELTARLAEGASSSLTAETSADRWATLLDALAYSPVRRQVKPQSLPEPPSDELLAMVRKVSARLPELAAQFGIEPVPEPTRRRPPGQRPPGQRSRGASTEERSERPRNSPV